MNIPIRRSLSRDVVSTEKPEVFIASERQYEYVEKLLDAHDEDAKTFWKWVLYEMLNRTVMMRSWIGIPAYAIRKELGWQYSSTDEIWNPLYTELLLDYIGHVYPLDGDPGQSRGFFIFYDHVLEYLKKWQGDRVDLFTGRKRRGTQFKTLESSNNGRRWPDPLGEALGILKDRRSLVNVPAVKQHLRDSLQELRDLKQSVPEPHRNSDYRTLHARVRNDFRCWNTIVNQGLSEASDMPQGIYEYDPAWRVQAISGRVSEKGGGGQNCSVEMKAAMRDIPGVKNYDIESSQMNLLRQKLDGAGIDTSYIDEILDKGKEHYADQLGMDVGLFKQVFYAVYFGAYIPENYSQAVMVAKNSNANLDFMELLYKEYEDELTEVFEEVRDFFSPLEQLLEEYTDHLLQGRERQETSKGEYYKNNCNVPFYPEEYEEGHERRAKAKAHVLQGDEAAFIHWVTILSEEYDYEVMANEHDGIIVLGDIPEQAEERARQESGFKTAHLKEKPFT